MKKFTVPGIVYSFILMAGVWAVEYFTTGPGSDFSLATVLVAGVPLLIKCFTVATTTPEPVAPASTTRNLGPEGTYVPAEAPPSKTDRLLWG